MADPQADAGAGPGAPSGAGAGDPADTLTDREIEVSDLFTETFQRAPPVESHPVSEASTMGGRLAVVGLVGALAAGGLLLTNEMERGEAPPFVTGMDAGEGPTPPQRDDLDLVRLAGATAALPLTRALSESFVEEEPTARMVVHGSIGSAGGIRAVADGVVDVGLIDRPLTPEEEALGLDVIPFAEAAVALVANPDVPLRNLRTEEVLDLYAGRRATWPDGQQAVVLMRPPGDRTETIALEGIEGLWDVLGEARKMDRWRVLKSEEALREALVGTSGAVTLMDAGAVTTLRLPVKVLRLDDVSPTPETLAAGRYPLRHTLSFVVQRRRTTRVDGFFRMVGSPEGQGAIRERGYLPLSLDAARGAE